MELQPPPLPPPLPSSSIYLGTSPFILPMMHLAAPTPELVVKPVRKASAPLPIASLPPLSMEPDGATAASPMDEMPAPTRPATAALAPPKPPLEYPSDLEPEEDDPVTLPPLLPADRNTQSALKQDDEPEPEPEPAADAEPEERPVPPPSQMLRPFGVGAEEHQRKVEIAAPRVCMTPAQRFRPPVQGGKSDPPDKVDFTKYLRVGGAIRAYMPCSVAGRKQACWTSTRPRRRIRRGFSTRRCRPAPPSARPSPSRSASPGHRSP